MKAAIIERFGSAESISIVDDFPIPKVGDNQVLVRVAASGLNPLDIMTRNGQLKLVRGRKLPVVLGNDASGTVIRCGKLVKDFHEGDEVYGMFDPNQSLSCTRFTKSGACAEYAVTRADTLALKPSNLSHTEAASIPLACLTAYQALKKISWKENTRVLINGASGGVGIFAVQLAKLWGAHVTGVCSSRNIDGVAALGADEVIDYQKHDITSINDKFDVIYDVAASASFFKCAHLLKSDGVFISNIINFSNFTYTQIAPFMSVLGYKKKNTFAFVVPSGDDLKAISELIKSEAIKPVVDKTYEITNLADAHKALESHRSFGKIVVTL